MATIFSDVLFIYVNSCNSARWDMGMGQYLQIPFLVGWTSIYQLFWGSLGYQGFDSYPYTDNYWYTTNNTQKLDDIASPWQNMWPPVLADERAKWTHTLAWLDVSRFTRFYRWSSQLENVFKCDKYIYIYKYPKYPLSSRIFQPCLMTEGRQIFHSGRRITSARSRVDRSTPMRQKLRILATNNWKTWENWDIGRVKGC